MAHQPILNVWGGGQLLGFSAFDGETDYDSGLVLRTVADCCGFEIKLPVESGIVLPDAEPPRACMLAGDHFQLECSSGPVRGAFADARHFIIDGECRVYGLNDALQIIRRPGRTVLGVRKGFNESWLDADFDAIFRQRAAWLAKLPQPGLPTDEARRTYWKACSQLKTQLNSPSGCLKHRWTTPDRWPHRKMWLWDSVFHAQGLRRLDPAVARETLEAVFDGQCADGFIPHMASPHEKSDITQPPILGYGIKLLLEQQQSPEFLERLYPKNAAFLNWIFAHRDTDGAGLVEWAIEAHEMCRSGESGMDNSTRFDGATQLDAPDFNAYLASECEIMAEFAALLGLPEEQKLWQERHRKLNHLMNERLWNDAAGLYVDYDLAAGKQSPVLSLAGFLPLISGAPTAEMAEKLVRNLKNPETFGTPFPVPSISFSQPEFYSKDMWRGPVWININTLIARGLDRYGYRDEARQLRSRTMRELEKFYCRYGTFFEFYDDRNECDPPELLRKFRCDPDRSVYHQAFMDYGWSATLYIDLAFTMYS